MKRVENATGRPPFFPNKKARNVKENIYSPLPEENGSNVPKEKAQNDSKVSIPIGTKIFSQIKKLVDRTPPKDNMEKIQSLRDEIRAGNYEVDENKLSEKVLQNEFAVWRDR